MFILSECLFEQAIMALLKRIFIQVLAIHEKLKQYMLIENHYCILKKAQVLEIQAMIFISDVAYNGVKVV